MEEEEEEKVGGRGWGVRITQMVARGRRGGVGGWEATSPHRWLTVSIFTKFVCVLVLKKVFVIGECGQYCQYSHLFDWFSRLVT